MGLTLGFLWANGKPLHVLGGFDCDSPVWTLKNGSLQPDQKYGAPSTQPENGPLPKNPPVWDRNTERMQRGKDTYGEELYERLHGLNRDDKDGRPSEGWLGFLTSWRGGGEGALKPLAGPCLGLNKGLHGNNQKQPKHG